MSMNHFYTVTNMCENNVQSSKVYSFSLCPSFSPLSVFSFTVGFGEVEHCGPKKKKRYLMTDFLSVAGKA